jgi:peptidoglycan/LPS O-acetylase OafA/YrhL
MDASNESANLDFLRTLAVLSVVLAHAQLLFEQRKYSHLHWLTKLHGIGGWGVLMFFVHTSLVLMFSLERQQRRLPGNRIYGPFLVRRVLRIYPLSVFVVLLVALCKFPVAHYSNGQFISADLPLPGVFANVFLMQDLTKADSVIAPLWSLPYEMQMYLLLPALYLLVGDTRRTWPMISIWVNVALLAHYFGFIGRPGIREFLMYVPCFLSGVIAYRLTMTRKLQLGAAAWPLTLVLITSLYLNWHKEYASWCCCLLLGIALPQFRELNNCLLRKVCATLARYSYGIYLLHFLCMWIAFQAIRGIAEWSRWTIFIVTVSVFPVLTYHLLEAPLMHADRTILPVLRAKIRLRRTSVA